MVEILFSAFHSTDSYFSQGAGKRIILEVSNWCRVYFLHTVLHLLHTINFPIIRLLHGLYGENLSLLCWSVMLRTCLHCR